jgi:hypothetical protein
LAILYLQLQGNESFIMKNEANGFFRKAYIFQAGYMAPQHSPVSTTEELLERKVAASVWKTEITAVGNPLS